MTEEVNLEQNTQTATQADPSTSVSTQDTTTPNSILTADADWQFDDYHNDANDKYDHKEFDEGFIELAKQNNLSKEQASAMRKAILDKAISEEIEDAKNAKDKQERDLLELQNTWGGQFTFRVGQINKLLLKMDGGNQDGPVHKYIAETGLDSDTRFVKFMDSIVSMLSQEDSTKINKRADVVSAESLSAEINRLMREKSYWDATDPAHQSIVNQVSSLYEKLYAE